MPADPSEDEQAASSARDTQLEEPTPELGEGVRLLDPSLDDIEIPRPSRPFRAWTAAHGYRDEPSLWERFRGWLAGLFREKKREEDPDQAEDAIDALVAEDVSVAPQSRPSFDD